jgi:hypothetical protein
MGYRWKPSAAQKAAYRVKCEEKDSLPIISSTGAIREGCVVEFYSLTKGMVMSGPVVNSSYGRGKGQHTFTIETSEGKIMVKGRNLYPNLLKHDQGEISKIESR